MVQISTYTNFGMVYGQNHWRYLNIGECFFKRKSQRSVSNKKIWNQNFHFKIRNKNTTFYPKIKN